MGIPEEEEQPQAFAEEYSHKLLCAQMFPAQGWKPGNVTGLGRLNISQKAHASALFSRKISTTYTIVF